MTLMVVDDNRWRPPGWTPFSGASSHSYPRRPAVKVAVWPGASAATLVLRQKRRLPSTSVTVIGSVRVPLTMKSVPVSAFSGRPPSAGGLKRGSRQVPVHVGVGSIFAFACVSLYETRVRYAVPEASMLASHRVFQKTSLPLKKARSTPASRAASTLARCPADQYSSWPTDRNTLCSRSSAPRRSVSTPVV